MLTYRPQLASLLLGALAISALVSCNEPAEQDAEPGLSSTPVVTSIAFAQSGPESARTSGAIDELPVAQTAVVPATANARQATSTTVPGVEPTPPPVPEFTSTATPVPPQPRAIASGEVDRIAFSDGQGSVHTVSPDGAGLVTIATGSLLAEQFHYTFPVWSPDGGSLVFSSFVIVANSVVQSAIHRADADGNGQIVTIAVDDPSQRGVGPGVPHFSSWSPDGERIALTTNSDFGIVATLLGSYSGEAPRDIALGAPLYVNWAPDGTAILVHQAEGLHLIPITESGSGAPIAIGNGSISFNSPSWSPDSRSFAHVESIDGVSSIVLTQKSDLKNSKVVADAGIRVALGWSPDGNHLAIARSAGITFHTLSIYSFADSSERTIYQGEIKAFWWSPDGTRLAIVENSPVIDLAHRWSVLDIESGEVTPLVTQFLSDDFLFVQDFFDQYRESHRIWAPDSSRLVIAGSLLDVDKYIQPGGAAELPETFISEVWVLDATGIEEPLSIGRGTIASWSPR